MLSRTLSTGRWLSGWIGTNVSIHHTSSFAHAKSNGYGATTARLIARHNGTYCGRNWTISTYRRTIWTHTGTSSTTHHILVISTKRTRYLHVQFIVQVSKKSHSAFNSEKKRNEIGENEEVAARQVSLLCWQRIIADTTLWRKSTQKNNHFIFRMN